MTTARSFPFRGDGGDDDPKASSLTLSLLPDKIGSLVEFFSHSTIFQYFQQLAVIFLDCAR